MIKINIKKVTYNEKSFFQSQKENDKLNLKHPKKIRTTLQPLKVELVFSSHSFNYNTSYFWMSQFSCNTI